MKHSRKGEGRRKGPVPGANITTEKAATEWAQRYCQGMTRGNETKNEKPKRRKKKECRMRGPESWVVSESSGGWRSDGGGEEKGQQAGGEQEPQQKMRQPTQKGEKELRIIGDKSKTPRLVDERGGVSGL